MDFFLFKQYSFYILVLRLKLRPKTKTKMRIVKPILTNLLLLFVCALSAQQIESSILKADFNSANFHLAVNEQGAFSVFNYQSVSEQREIEIFAFNEFSATTASKKITKPGNNFRGLGQTNQAYSNDVIAIATHSSPFTSVSNIKNFDLLLYDIAEDNLLSFSKPSLGHPSELYIDEEKILLLRNNDAFIEFFAMDLKGNELWSKKFEFFENNSLIDQYSFLTFSKFASVQYSNDGFYFVVFTLTNGRTLVLKLSEEGEQLASTIIEDCSLLEIQIDEQTKSIFYSGLSLRDDFGNLGLEKGILIKSDFDLNILQSNLIYTGTYPFLDVNMSLSGNEILLSSSSFSKNSLIYSTLDHNFVILDQYGYNIRTSRFRRGHHFSDSKIRYVITNDVSEPIVYKTNFKGEIDGLAKNESCLDSRALNLEFSDVEISSTEIDGLEPTESSVENTSQGFSETEWNGISEVNANFEIEDSLCVGDCALTTNVNNTLAESQQWHIIGPTVNEIIPDQEVLFYCFETAGAYSLSQTVFSYGCERTFSIDIFVANAALIVDDFEDEIICDDPPYSIILTGDEHLKNAIWSNGEEGLQIDIMESGFYEATVTNGFCEEVIGANFEFISDDVNPVFDFTDSLCIGLCDQAINTNASLADQQSWQITGPNIDATISNQESFSYCFDVAGMYTITQKTVVSSCERIFSRDIFILENEIEFDNLEDEVICEDSPYTISLSTDGNLNDVIWSTGEEGIQTTIEQSGFYQATITDDYCQAIVGANFEFIADLTGNQEVLQLPEDTLVCIQNLPYTFEVGNRFNSVIKLNGREIDDDIIRLNREGGYNILAEIGTCVFENDFNLQIDSCLSQIYIPTAFSPNSDGTNDFFEPLGSFFEIYDLSIYDRWGEKIYEGVLPWDGTYKGKFVQSNIYFYVLSYRNTLAGVDESIKGSFTLMN